MAAAADLIPRFRRMIAEPTQDVYSDVVLIEVIESHPSQDPSGSFPEYADWEPSYDLNAAAAEIWSEKAAALACNFDFSADGSNFSRSQAYQQAIAQARHFSARRKPSTIRLQMAPRPEVEDVD